MAIQVSGTEVISNARALTNIASVDATTVASLAAAGVGGGSWSILSNSGNMGYLSGNGGLSAINSFVVPSGISKLQVEVRFTASLDANQYGSHPVALQFSQKHSTATMADYCTFTIGAGGNPSGYFQCVLPVDFHSTNVSSTNSNTMNWVNNVNSYAGYLNKNLNGPQQTIISPSPGAYSSDKASIMVSTSGSAPRTFISSTTSSVFEFYTGYTFYYRVSLAGTGFSQSDTQMIIWKQ